MAQNAQRRSQPEASFSAAVGPEASRLRRSQSWPGMAGASAAAVRRGALHRADRQQRAAVARGVRDERPAGEDVVEPVADGGVVVEAEHGGLGQRAGELGAVALGHAADRDHRGAGVGGGEDRVDRVLLRRLDEAAGVDQDGVGVVGVVDQLVALGGEPAGELLGVDLVAGAAEGHHRHPRGQALGSCPSGTIGAGRGTAVTWPS